MLICLSKEVEVQVTIHISGFEQSQGVSLETLTRVLKLLDELWYFGLSIALNRERFVHTAFTSWFIQGNV